MSHIGWSPRELIPSPHILVLATSERFLPIGGTFRPILASESHWLQPVLVLFVHWWPTPAGVRRVLESGAHRGQKTWAYSRGLGERCRVDKACGWSVFGPCAQMSCCQVAPNMATWTAMMAPTHSTFRIIIITIIIGSPCLHTL